MDELAHARHAAAVCAAAGATGTPIFDPEVFITESHVDPALNIVVRAVPSLCLGETFALRAIHHLRKGACVPEVCDALDRVLRDEPRHAALGWAILDWMLELRPDAVRECVEREMPRWFTQLENAFAGPYPEPHLAAVDDADRAWGVTPVDEIREVFARTVERDWIPRLERRGLAGLPG